MEEIRLGDVIQTRKAHPCGSDRWQVIRIGADIKIKCLGCGRVVMMERPECEAPQENTGAGAGAGGGNAAADGRSIRRRNTVMQTDNAAENVQAAEEQELQPAEETKKGKEKKPVNVKKEILSWILTLGAAVIIALVIRTFLFEPVRVDGHSMDDTLANGEIMFVTKPEYLTGDPQTWSSAIIRAGATRISSSGSSAFPATR